MPCLFSDHPKFADYPKTYKYRLYDQGADVWLSCCLYEGKPEAILTTDLRVIKYFLRQALVLQRNVVITHTVHKILVD